MARYFLSESPVVSGDLFCSEFHSDTLGHAQTLAQSVATLFAKTIVLIPDGGLGPYTSYTPGSQGTTVTSPTGITF